MSYLSECRDALGAHTLPFLTLFEALKLSSVNKEFKIIYNEWIGLSSDDIRLMYECLDIWKLTRKSIIKLTNSWVRSIYHPDDRIILG